MGEPQGRARMAEQWKAYGRAMARVKAQHRREMGPSFEIIPIVTVPTGCMMLLLTWPLLAVLGVLSLSARHTSHDE